MLGASLAVASRGKLSVYCTASAVRSSTVKPLLRALKRLTVLGANGSWLFVMKTILLRSRLTAVLLLAPLDLGAPGAPHAASAAPAARAPAPLRNDRLLTCLTMFASPLRARRGMPARGRDASPAGAQPEGRQVNVAGSWTSRPETGAGRSHPDG